MTNSHSRRFVAILPCAVVASALVGCSAAPDGGNSADNDVAAAKFVVCLTEKGQTAKILEGGRVGLLMPENSTDSGGGLSIAVGGDGDPRGALQSVAVFMDDDGTWMAGGGAEVYPEDGGMREAWGECQAAVPEFVQPQPDLSGVNVQSPSWSDIIDESLAFAECARSEGYVDFADPDENAMLDFPLGMTEDSFRGLLEACVDPEARFGVSVSPESAQSFDFDWLAVMADVGAAGGLVTAPAEPTP